MGQVPSHEELDQNMYVPFNGNTMTHVTNHIDGKPSAHYNMRQIFIDIVCGLMTTPYGEMSRFTFAELPEPLIAELKSCLEQYDIKFDFSWSKKDMMNNKFHTYVDNLYSDESARKWEIEKKYLFFWLDRAKNGEVNHDPNKAVLTISPGDTSFVTDGERIASLYVKNILNKY